LIAAAALRQRGVNFEIVDAGRQPGGIWDIDRESTPMYESAHFISSRRLSGFPDFPMPETYPDCPRYDLILDYVRAFAKQHDLERSITFGLRVEAATRLDAGGWTIALSDGDSRACSAVCVATGTTWQPRVPQVPGQFAGESYHSFNYRSPKEFEGKRVLIVGGGNSGPTSPATRRVTRNARSSASVAATTSFPSSFFGQPTDVFAHSGPQLPRWLEERVFGLLMNRILVGDLTKYGLQKPGR
jgi:cation diffusion facilitator CzcD-associated flavoprotein CzcO